MRAVADRALRTYNRAVHTALILVVSFVAYATGAVACKRASASRPGAAVHPLETLLVTCLLIVIALLRPRHYSLVYHAVSASAMLITGASIARLTLTPDGRATAGTREFEGAIVASGLVSFWKRWLNFSHAVVDYEFRLLLVAIYLLIIGPFAITFRLLRATPSQSSDTNWTPRSDTPSLDAARKPF